MGEKLIKIFSGVFAFFWFCIVFIEYWRYNPAYAKAIQYFQYYDLLFLLLGLGGVISWKISKIKAPSKFINGLTVFIGFLLIDLMTMFFFYGKMNSISLSAKGLFTHWGHLIGVSLAVFLIYLVARTIGSVLEFVFPLKIEKTDLPVIHTVLGVGILTLLLFFLGVVGLLKVWFVAPILLLILVGAFRTSLQIIKSFLLQPIKWIGKLNTLGVFSFLFLATFLVFDFVQLLRPFPAGTDSINLYINLTKLIADYGALVPGHGLYNWSLFMSLGTVVFGRVDVALGLSFLGGLLSLAALFQLSRKWLDVNQSALCLLLFGSMPMTNYLWYQDVKIDMGLLFVTLCILLLLHNWIVPPVPESLTLKTTTNKKKTKNKKSLIPNKSSQASQRLLSVKTFFAQRIPVFLQENRLIVVISFLAGFAFGIKLTTLFFFLALGFAIWYIEGGFLALLTAFFLIFGVTFLIELDATSSLRIFHENVSVLIAILLIIGLGLSIYLFFKQKNRMIRLSKLSLILVVFFLLPVLPWFAKNISEGEAITFNKLLKGKKATPFINLKNPKELDKGGE
jgi:hypothetical protein